MAPPIQIQKLLEQEQDAKMSLKQAREELKDALEETTMYKEILEATLQQASDKCKVSDKVAAAHALKVTVANYTKEMDEDA
jgi:SMC interacting uncharacterized protein involved in chromosome segregation